MTSDVPVRIYHNPRCSKSRETLALLRARGIEPEIVHYLETPPDRDTLRALVQKLGLSPHALLRKGEPAYAALGLGPDSDLEAVLSALVREPILLERPVVEVGPRAALGRPPESVLALF